MSYFSENEDSIIDEGDEGDDLSSDESIDEELKNIFYKATYNNTYELEEDTVVSKDKTHKKQIKSSLTLQDFTKKVEAEKPVKFVSKRVNDKKPATVQKRCFNPRLPPYNFVHKKNIDQNININDNNDFPNLI
jgi:hypothetical protein